MATSVCWLVHQAVHPFGPTKMFLKLLDGLHFTFSTDIHSPQRMNPTDFGDFSSVNLTFLVLSEVFTTVGWFAINCASDIYDKMMNMVNIIPASMHASIVIAITLAR